jgi:hypothetical protein
MSNVPCRVQHGPVVHDTPEPAQAVDAFLEKCLKTFCG